LCLVNRFIKGHKSHSTVSNLTTLFENERTASYDINNHRIAKSVDADGSGTAASTIEWYVYDGQNIVLSFDGSGTQTHRYLHGTGIDQILADESAQGTG
jgi:hypothetical protein